MRELGPIDLLECLIAAGGGSSCGEDRIPVLDGAALTDESWHCVFPVPVPLPPDLGFRTSGTTGPQTVWLRDAASLHAEADVIIGELGLDDVDMVVSLAPPGHLYGFVAGVMVPSTIAVGARYVSLRSPWPPSSLPSHTLVAATPAALSHLHRLLPLGRGRLTVVHSTAGLPSSWWDSPLASSSAVACFELFGSTECGLIATRRASRTPGDWRLAADVSLAPAMPLRRAASLAVTSPRLARQPDQPATESLVLDDIVVATTPSTFRRVGRRTRLVKVNGIRVHLDEIERQLIARARQDLVCIPVSDPLRGESFEIRVAGGPALEREVASLCRELLSAHCQPRAVRSVAVIPRTATGKPQHSSAHEWSSP